VTDSTSDIIQPEQHFLAPGYVYFAAEPTLISTVLGSCCAVCIYDAKNGAGGMNHFLYAETCNKREATSRYGNAATIALIRLFLDHGSTIKNLEAHLIGGAHNRDISPENIGHKNVLVARRILMRRGVRIVSEDTGGSWGRKVVFNTSTGETAIMKVKNIRRSDWYPYEGDR